MSTESAATLLAMLCVYCHVWQSWWCPNEGFTGDANFWREIVVFTDGYLHLFPIHRDLTPALLEVLRTFLTTVTCPVVNIHGVRLSLIITDWGFLQLICPPCTDPNGHESDSYLVHFEEDTAKLTALALQAAALDYPWDPTSDSTRNLRHQVWNPAPKFGRLDFTQAYAMPPGGPNAVPRGRRSWYGTPSWTVFFTPGGAHVNAPECHRLHVRHVLFRNIPRALLTLPNGSATPSPCPAPFDLNPTFLVGLPLTVTRPTLEEFEDSEVPEDYEDYCSNLHIVIPHPIHDPPQSYSDSTDLSI